MSVSTRHTLLCLSACALIYFRFVQTQPALNIGSTIFDGVVKVTDIPYSKNNKLYVSNNSPYLIITSRFPSLEYGDVLKVKGKIKENRIISNPKIEILSNRPNQIVKILFAIRLHCEQILRKLLPSDHAALAQGMLLGTKAEFSEPIDRALQSTGTLHMIVVSGFNLTLVISSITAAAGYLKRRTALVAAFVGCVLFVLLTGAQPPAIRAGIMASILLFSKYFGRPVDTIRIVIITIVICLTVWPQLIISLSFQLSVAATAGVVLLPEPLNRALRLIQKRYGFSLGEFAPWIRFVKDEFLTTLAAQIAVLPLSMYTFGMVSLVGPLANIAVAWLVPYIMVSTLIVCLADFTYPLIAKVVSFELYGITAFFLQVLILFSRIPYAVIDGFNINFEILLGFYIILGFITVKFTSNKKYSNMRDNEKEKNE